MFTLWMPFLPSNQNSHIVTHRWPILRSIQCASIDTTSNARFNRKTWASSLQMANHRGLCCSMRRWTWQWWQPELCGQSSSQISTIEISVVSFRQTRGPSCRPTNSVEALKDADWGRSSIYEMGGPNQQWWRQDLKFWGCSPSPPFPSPSSFPFPPIPSCN